MSKLDLEPIDDQPLKLEPLDLEPIKSPSEEPSTLSDIGTGVAQGVTFGFSDEIIAAAKALENAGVFAIVLEMVPQDLAKQITELLSVPTIGIGAGNGTDAQVLVWTDAFGLTKNPPKLARSYRNLRQELLAGAKEFARDVQNGAFPSDNESFN